MSERFTNPPIKRHPTLQPLSREHFNGLVLVRRLREAAEGDEAARRATREMLASAWRDELAAHFADEERLLAPFVSDCDRARLIEDHRSLQRHIEMAATSRQAPSAAWLRDTAEMLEKHIRWEERELFPAAEKHGAAGLDALAPEAARIEQERPGARRRQDEPGPGRTEA
ncbi:MAG TPA: hemerythrin domain-containing protein [Phycisphaerales bacterium]|nr:hemerythrin domain-containing protein [Phycisphaerales bacterium]